MHLISVSGGIGNQLFQYAFARYVSSQSSTRVYLHWTADSSPLEVKFELDKFLIVKLPVLKNGLGSHFAELGHINPLYIFFLRLLRKWKLIKKGNKLYALLTTEVHQIRETIAISKQTVPEGGSAYYEGNWQSAEIVDRVRPLLLQDLKPKISLSPKSQEILTQIKNTPNATSLHVRGLWQLTSNRKIAARVKHVQGTLSARYYTLAIEQIEKRRGVSTFFVFADEIDTAAALLTKISPRIPLIYVKHDNRASWEDLHLMQHCQNFILSNSTFAWWACWFAHATRPQEEMLSIMPKNWMANANAYGRQFSDRLKISANTIQL